MSRSVIRGIDRLGRSVMLGVSIAIVALLLIELFGLLNGTTPNWPASLERLAFVALVLGAAWLGQPTPQQQRWLVPFAAWGCAGIGLLAAAVYAIIPVTVAAWLLLAGFFVLLLWLDTIFSARRRFWQRWPVHGLLAAVAGTAPVLVNQAESHFSDEEFFIALQALELAGVWLALLLAARVLRRHTRPTTRCTTLRVPRWSGLALAALPLLGLFPAATAYQRSFFPATAPGFAGISRETPFVCGTVAPAAQRYDGTTVFQHMLANIAALPNKSTLSLGMLAVGTKQQPWATAFRTQLLGEARQQLYTGPANSVKYIQYEASLRLYYYTAVRAAFPQLFSAADQSALRAWFGAINRRALTVEWVDWLYALALGQWPEGPYENQESGAGLLALMQSAGLADPALARQNQDYLDRNRRGWLERFRNTDDTAMYQPEWINSAMFQSTVTGPPLPAQVRRSFEWLLLQALPDGAPLRYNYPYDLSLTSISYLGATLLDDSRFVWLAGRSLEAGDARGLPVTAQPGAVAPLAQAGVAPTAGSCLLYGDSGMPNQVGPLAPDKVVLRTGWEPDSLYAMLDLRFTGWHRYKATNALTLVYQQGPLVAEQLEQPAFAWLPKGRSFFRDKRVPRENLNGVLVARSGLSAVLAELTALGGPWAQDPPFYAQVDQFTTAPDRDVSRTLIADWHSWTHQRTITLDHSGLLVIDDMAHGPAGVPSGIVWHPVAGATVVADDRIRLRGGSAPAELLLLPITGGTVRVERGANASVASVLYQPPSNGQLRLVSVFLTKQWAGAAANIVPNGAGFALHVRRGAADATVPLE